MIHLQNRALADDGTKVVQMKTTVVRAACRSLTEGGDDDAIGYCNRAFGSQAHGRTSGCESSNSDYTMSAP